MRERKNVSLDREVIDDIEERTKEDGFNFSQWVEDKYVEELMTEKGALIKQKKHEISAKKWRNLAYALKRKRRNLLKNMSKEQTIELQMARDAVNRNPDYLHARFNLWNSQFKPKISKIEFMDLIKNE